MKKYSRVSYEIRCQIDAHLQAKYSIPEIANKLGYHKSTIYRELKRNKTFSGTYSPKMANKISRERYKRCRKRYIMKGETLELVIRGLKEGWSPEQISGRLKRSKVRAPSHTCIYKYIYNDFTKKDLRNNKRVYHFELAKLLRNHGKRGCGRYIQRRNVSKFGLSIRKRPEAANNRNRIGDWERDTMHTANGIHLLVMNDRKSRLTKVKVLSSRKNIEVDKATIELINETGRKALTITNDNGSDFKASKNLPYKVYFCDPYTPQQRGTVENSIGLLRQYIKRKTDVSNLNVKEFEDKLNNRPRKVLDYQTPNEVYFKKRVALASLI